MKCISAIHAQSGSYLAIVTDWLFFFFWAGIFNTHYPGASLVVRRHSSFAHARARTRRQFHIVGVGWSSFTIRMTERKIIHGPFFLLMFVSWNELPVEQETRGERGNNNRRFPTFAVISRQCSYLFDANIISTSYSLIARSLKSLPDSPVCVPSKNVLILFLSPFIFILARKRMTSFAPDVAGRSYPSPSSFCALL